MPQPLGIAFAPTSDNAAMAGKTPGTAPQFSSPVQVLNYRLPTVSPNAISPLMSQQQQGSGISSAVLESVLKTVFGPDGLSGALQPTSRGDESGSDRMPLPSGGTFSSQAPQPTTPRFEGNIDTPPTQNAPQFDGGGYNAPNGWEALTMNQDDPNQRQLLQWLWQQFMSGGQGNRGASIIGDAGAGNGPALA